MIIEEHYVEQQLLSPQQRKLFFCEFYVILLMNIFIKRAYLTSRSKLDSVLFQGGKYLEATLTLRSRTTCSITASDWKTALNTKKFNIKTQKKVLGTKRH